MAQKKPKQRAKSHGTTAHFHMRFWMDDTVDEDGNLKSRFTAGVPSQIPITNVQVSIRRGEEAVWTAPKRVNSWLTIQDGLSSVTPDVVHTLVLEPHPDQLSPGPCTPHTGREKADVPGGRVKFDMQFRPLEIDFKLATFVIGGEQALTIQGAVAHHDTTGDRGPHGRVRIRLHETGHAKLEIDWKPDWFRRVRTFKKATQEFEKKLSPHPIGLKTDTGVPDMVVLHRTGGESIGKALNTVLSPKSDAGGYHYLVDRDGHIVKLMRETHGGWHTETSFWHPLAGPGKEVGLRQSPKNTISRFSVGIEHVDGNRDYPKDQIKASINLMKRIIDHFDIEPQLVVGHSDVRCKGTPGNASLAASARPWDPSFEFPWPEYEAKGLALKPDSETKDFPGMYGGVFESHPDILLRPGDRDSSHRFGGKNRAGITGTPVRELQEDLATIGYALGLGKKRKPDGKYSGNIRIAVVRFQTRYFSGDRMRDDYTGRKRKTEPNGLFDRKTAIMLKQVVKALS
jgi:N-acetyl-anhydromuramyl-L-alanine amidase AmpD